MKTLHTSLFLLLSLLFVGCQKSEIPFYNEQYDAVRFPYSTDDKGNKEPTGYVPADKTFYKAYSFFSTPNAESYVDSIPLYLIGIKSNDNRKVNIEVVKEESSPTDFFEVLEASIPANKTIGSVKIKLMNLPKLKEENARVTLLIRKSESLLAGPPEFTKAVLSWGIRLEAPTLTKYFTSYNALIQGADRAFSESREYFSLNALEVIVKALDWNDWNSREKHGENYANKDGYKYLPWEGAIKSTYRAYAKKIADYIEKYNKEHPEAPLTHDSGKLKGKPIQARTN